MSGPEKGLPVNELPLFLLLLATAAFSEDRAITHGPVPKRRTDGAAIVLPSFCYLSPSLRTVYTRTELPSAGDVRPSDPGCGFAVLSEDHIPDLSCEAESSAGE